MSMLILKMMSNEDMPDHNASKGNRMVLIKDTDLVEFSRTNSDEPLIIVTNRDGDFETYHPGGNSYLMNEQGLTISTFAHTQYKSGK